MKLFTIGAVLILVVAGRSPAFAQNPSGLIDGRYSDPQCTGCQLLIKSKPKEVLFGIDIDAGGNVYFEINSEDLFRKIFVPGMGVTADLVSRDRYDCDKFLPGNGWFRGYVLPTQRWENFSGNRKVVGGYIRIRIGQIPPSLRKKEIEANLVIVNHNKVCYYSNFVDIDRSIWDMLPMGLYTDTLLHVNPGSDSPAGGRFTYAQKVQVIVPFARNKATYSGNDITRLYDSLNLKNCIIKKVDIRAYSSVEGPESVNEQLMKARAGAMINTLRKIQPGLRRIKITSAENWLDFYQEINRTSFDRLARLTRGEIKVRLLDKPVADSLEPILAKERKAIVTLYYEQRSGLDSVKSKDMASSFQHAIAGGKIDQARRIQKEIVERISDNRLPDDYLDKLEVPKEAQYWELLNDQIIYKYQLNQFSEYEALDGFRELMALDPANGRIRYNVCALRLFEWHMGGDSVGEDSVGGGSENTNPGNGALANGGLGREKGLFAEISGLPGLGIDRSLVRRMLVNYHILRSVDLFNKQKYEEKDKSVRFIKENYQGIPLTDEDRFSLAKYFAFYSQKEWAKELIVPRIDQLDVSEDLVFYYVNLEFFKSEDYADEKFGKALLNASILNRGRFCRFFKTNNNGGASMQLLEEPAFRQIYCEKCRQVDPAGRRVDLAGISGAGNNLQKR